MAIEKISGLDIMPKGAIETMKNYAESLPKKEENMNQLEKIREENKGVNIDTTA